MSDGIEAQLQDFGGRPPEDLAAALRALVFPANQDPALANVFGACTANVPQLFPDVVHCRAAAALGGPEAEIFPVVLQAGFGSSCVHLVH